MALPNFLDPCIPIRPVVCGGCADDEVDPGCSTQCVSVSLCPPVIVDPPGQRCVNDNVRRPWPSPPPAETGCSPVTVDVSNQPIEPEDEDQSLRLEGTVDYIAGDACLPRLNLTLKAPPWLGGGSSNPLIKTGCGYTSLGGAFRIGPLDPDLYDDYPTPDEFFAKEHGAETFIPVDPWTQEYDCKQCNAKEAFGAQVSNYSLVGPMLAKIVGFTSIGGVLMPGAPGSSIYTTWEYQVELVGNIRDILRDELPPIASATCTNVDKWYEQGTLGVGLKAPPQTMLAYNIKETVLPRTGTATHLPPGTDLVAMYEKGYAPVAVKEGTPIMLYGYVPWAKGATPADCNCSIVWFFDEQLTFQGDCPATGGQQSLMPSRNLLDAGEFYGSSETEGRV